MTTRAIAEGQASAKVAATAVMDNYDYADNGRDEGVVMPHNVGHLLEEPTEIVCPACGRRGATRVQREAVTCLQRFVAVVNFCLCCTPIRWGGRHDVNHYCARCGCFIGRHITLSWYKRQLFRIQRSEVETDNRWQRFVAVQKEELDRLKVSKMREAGPAEP